MNMAMAPHALWLAAPLLALLVFTPIKHASAGDQPTVRQAAVAGAFYPDDPKALSTMIDGLLAKVTGPPVTDPIIAAVAPHAGYQYSGPTAAYTYAALKGRNYSRVVIIAPSHYESFDYSSVYEGDAYATPLGNVPVDKEFARKLVKMSSALQSGAQSHIRWRRTCNRGSTSVAAKSAGQF